MARPKQNILYTRNPIYVFYILVVVTLYAIILLMAQRPEVGPIEHAIFNALYYIPEFFIPIFIVISFFGSIVTSLLISILLILRHRKDIAIRVLASASVAYVLSTILKTTILRPRPEQLLNYVAPKIEVVGYGFPAIYAAVSIATGLTLALYAPRVYRRWIIAIITVIGCSGVFLGVFMPLDVIGGWLVGIFSYSAVSLALGSKHVLISPKKLAKRLEDAGMAGVKLKSAKVDARGSVPFFGTYNGDDIFVKVFNQDNNAADWLFKLIRRIQYRRLEDEVPSLTPKRAIEHEAYLTMLARFSAKARVPEVLGIYKVGTNSYAMATIRIGATGLNKLSGEQITDMMLDQIWQQISILHTHRIIHKDLRAANVMIEDGNMLPWIIDFGFSECAVDADAYYKDTVEFIASSATRVGAQRAVAAAIRALGKKTVVQATPYMQYAALSGATTTDLKNRRGLLGKVRTEMQQNQNLHKLEKARLSRIPTPRVRRK